MYKTKWSCKVFGGMETVKSFTLEPGGHFTTKDFEELEGVQTLDTAVTDMSAWSVNYWLSKFIQEVKKIFWGAPSFPFVVLSYLRTEAPPY